MGEEGDRLAALEEENRLLREENERLRRLLNDPDKLLQRGLHILAAMQGPILNGAVLMLRFWQELAHLTAPISPWW